MSEDLNVWKPKGAIDMKQIEIDTKVAALDAAAKASEERAFEILAEAFEDTNALSFGGQLKAAAQCLRDRGLFKAEAQRIDSIPSDETLAEEGWEATTDDEGYDRMSV